MLPQAKPPSLRILPARTGLLPSIFAQLLFRQKVSRLFAGNASAKQKRKRNSRLCIRKEEAANRFLSLFCYLFVLGVKHNHDAQSDRPGS